MHRAAALPTWQPRQTFIVALLLFVGGMIALTTYTLWRQRADAIVNGLDISAMHSQNFEDFLTQSLHVTELIAANTLAQEAEAQKAGKTELGRIETTFGAILRHAPFLRSLSLLDEGGRIIASSNPANVGITVSTQGYLPPEAGKLEILRIGQPWAGRDFAGGRPTTASQPLGSEAASIIPVTRTLAVGTRTLTLLVALNPDYFINNITQHVGPEDGNVEVLRYDGMVLMDTADDTRTGSLRDYVVRDLQLAEVESGAFEQSVGEQNVGGHQHFLTAFRASRLYPFIVVTHLDRDHALRIWRADATTLLGVVIPVLLAITLLAGVFYRRHMQLEAQRAKSERLQQINATVFGASTDAIVITDLDARIISVNAAFTRTTGYSAEEAVGRTPRLLNSGRQSRDFYVRMWDDILRRGIWHGELINRRKDGSLYDALATITSFRDFDGRLQYFISVSTDITERKTAEDQLRKLSSAVDQSPASIFITDLNGRIEYVNDAFCATTGYSRIEVLGQNPRILKSGKTPPATYVALWESLTHGRPWQGEFHNRRKDGSDYVELANITPLRQPNGAISHFVAAQEDITEQKRLSLELEGHRYHLEELVAQRTTELVLARHQAEDATRAKSLFLATMSHEIRTPMNGILGMARLARDSSQDPTVHEQLDMLTSSAVSLLTIINDILDFSKLEAGKFDFDVLPFNLSQVANAVITLLRTRAEEQGISLETEIDPALPAWLVGDSGRLRQILLNLIGNAVKFTATGGVLVAAHAIPAPAGAVGIEFAITDTGIGIDDEAQKNLFGSFAQADSSISRRYGGSGLGLAISKRLVEGQGGTIGVESEPGKGSRFWFRIFYAAGAAPADAGAAAAIVQLPPLRILLAEDNPVNQKVALGLLAKGSHLITIANNGREAVEAAAAGTFDVVLMDVQMPIMDGLTAAREIRRLPGAAGAVPIIALTANAMREDAERCSAAGMNACVTKPIDPATLFERLGHVLASNTCPGQSANGGDNDIVEQISSHLGAEAMAELVEIFLSAGADDLQHLLLLAESGSLAEIRHYAHDLKGMAGYVGADTLGKLMAAVEKAAINGDAATSRALLAGLPLAWEAAVAQLAAAPPQVT